MNIDMLRDADDDAGFYAAACGADPSRQWGGAVLYWSKDGGSTYVSLASITAAAVMGQTTNALADFHGGNIVDEISTLNVRIKRGTLSSVTGEQLLSGSNLCIVGDEVLCFRDAKLEVDGTYTLRGLLRGRRGSEYAMAGHAALERFVLADLSMVRVPQTTADIGATRQYKAVTVGSSLAASIAVTFKNEGCGLKPYAPVHLGGGRTAAGDVVLNWVRRNRITGEWRDSVDVPMTEASEAYEVDIFTDGTYASVKRTLSGLTSPTATYTAAQQTSDFGALQATVYWRVYQLSATVGRGHGASGSI